VSDDCQLAGLVKKLCCRIAGVLTPRSTIVGTSAVPLLHSSLGLVYIGLLMHSMVELQNAPLSSNVSLLVLAVLSRMVF
jgi:hypothetical protein